MTVCKVSQIWRSARKWLPLARVSSFFLIWCAWYSVLQTQIRMYCTVYSPQWPRNTYATFVSFRFSLCGAGQLVERQQSIITHLSELSELYFTVHIHQFIIIHHITDFWIRVIQVREKRLKRTVYSVLYSTLLYCAPCAVITLHWCVRVHVCTLYSTVRTPW